MRVYTTLLVFTRDATILADKDGQPPVWTLNDTNIDSLEIVRTGLYSISGVSPVFYGHIDQVGTFEFFDSEKHLYIVYVIYFPEKFNVINELYSWIHLNECQESSRLYKIIRYIYGDKQYVQKKSINENRMSAGRKVSVKDKYI